MKYHQKIAEASGPVASCQLPVANPTKSQNTIYQKGALNNLLSQVVFQKIVEHRV